MTLDLAAVVAGTKYRGQFEERLKNIMKEIRRAKNQIICSSTNCTPSSARARPKGAIDASNMLKPALARGELQCIGATTMDEYRKYIEKDAALERRFQTDHGRPALGRQTPSRSSRVCGPLRIPPQGEVRRRGD
jgi:ATP-dependent Clp protease ATP-binding subunit ClpC